MRASRQSGRMVKVRQPARSLVDDWVLVRAKLSYLSCRTRSKGRDNS